MAMNFRATVKQFLAIPHYHPTPGEIWTYPRPRRSRIKSRIPSA